MRQAMILIALLILSSAVAQPQTQSRAQNQEKLVQFLATDLQMTPDQVSAVRGFVKQSDNEMAKYEAQYFGSPTAIAKLRKQVTMDLGKKVERILTPAQLEQYPRTKQKLYNILQARYETGMTQKQSQEGKSNEMEPAVTREPK